MQYLKKVLSWEMVQFHHRAVADDCTFQKMQHLKKGTITRWMIWYIHSHQSDQYMCLFLWCRKKLNVLSVTWSYLSAKMKRWRYPEIFVSLLLENHSWHGNEWKYIMDRYCLNLVISRNSNDFTLCPSSEVVQLQLSMKGWSRHFHRELQSYPEITTAGTCNHTHLWQSKLAK